MTEQDLSWVPPGVDTGKASVALVCDYWLGGTHNFQAAPSAKWLEAFQRLCA